MSKTTKYVTSTILIIAIIALGYLVWYMFGDTFSNISQVKDDLDTTISQLEEEINTPGPLIENQTVAGKLSIKGIIEQTNQKRLKRGLNPLKENSKLNSSARVKVLDMFEDQYFAHQSPDGLGVGNLVENENYNYLIVGENLALGNFNGDEGVVRAWMDSPGHRANILKEGYIEIGVGVCQGEYNGEKVWMAVQHFGTSKSVCDPPDESVKEQVQANNDKLKSMKEELGQLEAEIEDANNRDEYRQVRQEYNQLVAEYNNLVKQTKVLSDQYNFQVSSYNNCLSSY